MGTQISYASSILIGMWDNCNSFPLKGTAQVAARLPLLTNPLLIKFKFLRVTKPRGDLPKALTTLSLENVVPTLCYYSARIKCKTLMVDRVLGLGLEEQRGEEDCQCADVSKTKVRGRSQHVEKVEFQLHNAAQGCGFELE